MHKFEKQTLFSISVFFICPIWFSSAFILDFVSPAVIIVSLPRFGIKDVDARTAGSFGSDEESSLSLYSSIRLGTRLLFLIQSSWSSEGCSCCWFANEGPEATTGWTYTTCISFDWIGKIGIGLFRGCLRCLSFYFVQEPILQMCVICAFGFALLGQNGLNLLGFLFLFLYDLLLSLLLDQINKRVTYIYSLPGFLLCLPSFFICFYFLPTEPITKSFLNLLLLLFLLSLHRDSGIGARKIN